MTQDCIVSEGLNWDQDVQARVLSSKPLCPASYYFLPLSPVKCLSLLEYQAVVDGHMEIVSEFPAATLLSPSGFYLPSLNQHFQVPVML